MDVKQGPFTRIEKFTRIKKISRYLKIMFYKCYLAQGEMKFKENCEDCKIQKTPGALCVN